MTDERDERFPFVGNVWRSAMWVGAGGGLGAVARFAILGLFPSARDGFPAGTLVVNCVGSLLLGFALGWFSTERGRNAPDWVRPFVLAGFIGSFTTLSLVVVDHAILLADGRNVEALAFLLVTLLGTVAIAALGLAIGVRAGRAANGVQR